MLSKRNEEGKEQDRTIASAKSWLSLLRGLSAHTRVYILVRKFATPEQREIYALKSKVEGGEAAT